MSHRAKQVGNPTPTLGSDCYEGHGLHIASSLPVATDRFVNRAKAIKLRIHPGHELSPTPVGARVLSTFRFHDGSRVSHTQDAAGFLSTYFDKVQFRLSEDRVALDVFVTPNVELDWVGILLAASYPAFLLFLEGRVPLHASAVWLPELSGTIGVLGKSGSGKSTIAGALCVAGGRLVSDDLLSLDPAAADPRCEPGSRHLRLRQPSEELAVRFGAACVGTSPDGRFVVDAREPLPDQLPLKLLLQPVLDPLATDVRLERLSPAEAFQAVACDPRIKGLTDLSWIRAAFKHASRLAREVPVYRVVVPFTGRNFGDIGRRLMEAFRKL
jgi:hypothetical protein